MNFKREKDKDSFSFFNKSKWYKLKTPGIILTQILGISIAVSVVGLIYSYIINYTYIEDIYLDMVEVIVSFIIIIPMHGIMHKLILPDLKQTIFRIIPNKIISCSFLKREVSRNRLVISLIFPFVMLTILPIIVLSFIRVENNFVCILIIINAVVSYVDILTIFLLLLQVPKSAYIKNIDNETYWKWN